MGWYQLWRNRKDPHADKFLFINADEMKDRVQERNEKIEKIFQDAGSHGVKEAFLESFGQMVTQSVIITSSGHISYTQMFSLPVSILALSFGASKAFFTIRSGDDKNPDPNLKMLLSIIFPLMLVQVGSSAISWTCIVGVLGGLVFPFVVGSIFTSLASQKALEWWLSTGRRRTARSGMRNCLQLCQSTDHGEDETVEEGVELQNGNNEIENIENADEQDSFTFLATLTSSFVPCVNGNKPHTLIVTGIVSHFSKLTIFIITYVFNSFWVDIRGGKVFMIWCLPEDTLDMFNTTAEFCTLNTNTSHLPYCIQTNSSQMTRVCEPSENEFRIVLFTTLGIGFIISLVSTIFLHYLSNWETMMKVSSRILCCIPTTPFIHRTVLWSKMDEGPAKLEEFLSDLLRTHPALVVPLLTTTNTSGETGYEWSVKNNKTEIQRVLVKYGGAGPDRFYGDVLAGKIFPNLSLILSSGEDLNTSENISKELEYFTSFIPYLKIKDRKVDDDWNQHGDRGISHCQAVDTVLGLALIVWHLSDGDQKKKAEKNVELLIDSNLKIWDQYQNLQEIIKSWNTVIKII